MGTRLMPGTRAVFIFVGVMGGFGLGYYLKERYLLKRKEEQCRLLQHELEGLVHTRKSMEKLLKND